MFVKLVLSIHTYFSCTSYLGLQVYGANTFTWEPFCSCHDACQVPTLLSFQEFTVLGDLEGIFLCLSLADKGCLGTKVGAEEACEGPQPGSIQQGLCSLFALVSTSVSSSHCL